MRPQSTTQLHANIQLDSLVTSWPSSYVLHHAAYNHNHPQNLWTPRMGDLIEGIPHPMDLAGPRPPGVLLFSLWWKPCDCASCSPINISMRSYCIWVSQAIDVAAVTGCSITVRRAPWWHNTMCRIPSSSNPLQRRQRVKAKMVYIQHIFPTLFPYSVFTLLCQKCSLWNSNFVVDLPLNS